MKFRNKILTLTASLVMTVPMISMVSCGNKEEDQHEGLMYNLDFADSRNFGKNAAGTDYEDAEIKGGGIRHETPWKDHRAINLMSKAYFILPSNLLSNKETITISLWTKERSKDRGDIFSFSDGNQTISLSLHGDKEQWNAFDLKLIDNNGQITHLITPKADKKAKGVSPEVGCVQSVIEAWQLVTITFDQSGLTIFVNGKKIKEFDGDYSFTNKKIDQFILGRNLADETPTSFGGNIADVKIYDQALTEEEIASEYDLSYKDFLTTDFEFNEENPFKDSVRGLAGTAKGDDAHKAKIDTDGERTYLSLTGERGYQAQEKAESWLELPDRTFFGHNEVTISSDLNIRQARKLARLFSVGSYNYVSDDPSEVNRYFEIYTGFKKEDSHRLKLESVENSSEDVLPENSRQFLMDDNSAYQTNVWFNVTFTIGHNQAVMYIDGYPVSIKDNFIYNPGNLWNYDQGDQFKCAIGRSFAKDPHTTDGNNYSLDAMIDNFKIYSVALSPKEVAETQGVEIIKDDNEAVQQVVDNFKLSKLGDSEILTHSFNEQGVEIVCQSKDWSIVDVKGNVFPSTNDRSCPFIITASRGNVSQTFEKTFSFTKTVQPELVVDNVGLDHAKYTDNTKYTKAMEYNATDMMMYDKDRFLVNYQKMAGITPRYGEGYGGWIRKNCGGEGQFETFYVGALARLSQSMPGFEYQNESPAQRCKYMIEKIKECQEHFGQLYPEDAGYLGAFPIAVFDALAGGQRRGRAPGSDCSIWVPYYMYHKNLMMCYDVYTYYVGQDDTETQTVRKDAYEMLKKAALWVYNKTKDYTKKERDNILLEEFGGIAEILYLTSDLVMKNEHDTEAAHKIFTAARFFQENDLIVSCHDGINVLAQRHVNTTIPKFLACCAEYQVTGDEYYLVAAQNFFDMMADHMSYPDGGLGVHEDYENPDELTLDYESNETCCCYNMLRLADYLFKFTGDAKYARYFENTFYNHIMGAINTEDVNLGQGSMVNAGKVYSTPTAFGYHKLYSNQRTQLGETVNDGAFWCCCCSGQETFAKLTYGNFYTNKDKDIYVNMYNPISLIDGNNTIVSLSGDDVNDNKTTNTIKLNLTNVTDGQKIHLIKPTWCLSMAVTLNGQEIGEDDDDYITVTVGQEGVTQGSEIHITFIKSYHFVEQKGFEEVEHEGKTYHSNCLFFGPTMLVANLGTIAQETIDKYFVYIFTSVPNNYTDLGGPISQYNSVYASSIDPISTYFDIDSESNFDHILTTNNGAIRFTPFMNITYEFYSMYMYYNFTND